MIRQLAQCPYCQKCEVSLDDHPRVIFNPDTPGLAPCEHLVWVDGRYSQWEPNRLGVNRMIGSTEFRWDHPDFGAVDGEHTLTSYLKELVSQGASWEFAPTSRFALQPDQLGGKGDQQEGKAIYRLGCGRGCDLRPGCTLIHGRADRLSE
jgi:hypothetical protein